MTTLTFTPEELAYIDREMHEKILEGLENKYTFSTCGKSEITIKPYARVPKAYVCQVYTYLNYSACRRHASVDKSRTLMRKAFVMRLEPLRFSTSFRTYQLVLLHPFFFVYHLIFHPQI